MPVYANTPQSDVLVLSDDNDVFEAPSGGDGAGDDSVSGAGGRDILVGGTGEDTLFGDSGWDVLFGGDGDDLLYGGAGNDVLRGFFGADRLFGGDGDDVVASLGGAVVLGGGAGDDEITSRGSSQDSTIYGGAGDDEVIAGDGADLIVGEDGRDVLFAGGGVDTLFGGAGQNLYYTTNDGRDFAYGGADEDSFITDGGGDVLVGGEGDDFLNLIISHSDGVRVGTTVDTVTVDLGAAGSLRYTSIAAFQVDSDGDDRLFGGNGMDTVAALGGGNDTLRGNGGADRVVDFGTGADELYGGFGDDIVGVGDSVPRPNDAADTLYGGQGADEFSFRDVQTSEPGRADLIADFERGLDLIRVPDSRDSWDPAIFIGQAAFRADGTVQVRVDLGAFHVDIDGNGRGDMTVRVPLTVSGRLIESDFIL